MLYSPFSKYYLEKWKFYSNVFPWQVERLCAWLWTASESRRVLRKQEVLGKFQIVVHQMLKSEYTHLAGIKSLVSVHMTFLFSAH